MSPLVGPASGNDAGASATQRRARRRAARRAARGGTSPRARTTDGFRTLHVGHHLRAEQLRPGRRPSCAAHRPCRRRSRAGRAPSARRVPSERLARARELVQRQPALLLHGCRGHRRGRKDVDVDREPEAPGRRAPAARRCARPSGAPVGLHGGAVERRADPECRRASPSRRRAPPRCRDARAARCAPARSAAPSRRAPTSAGSPTPAQIAHGHVGCLAGRRGARIVEIEVAVDVRESAPARRRLRATRPRRLGRARSTPPSTTVNAPPRQHAAQARRARPRRSETTVG